MKVLFLSGGDYAALTFEECFKGKKVGDLIKNLPEIEKEFLEKNPEYDGDFRLEVKDLNVDQDALNEIVGHVGDSDYLKSENLYGEFEVLRG